MSRKGLMIGTEASLRPSVTKSDLRSSDLPREVLPPIVNDLPVNNERGWWVEQQQVYRRWQNRGFGVLAVNLGRHIRARPRRHTVASDIFQKGAIIGQGWLHRVVVLVIKNFNSGRRVGVGGREAAGWRKDEIGKPIQMLKFIGLLKRSHGGADQATLGKSLASLEGDHTRSQEKGYLAMGEDVVDEVLFSVPGK
ncbi:hypothetical protein B0H17DRAFT_1137519 [Mycena rosella]|uniref:Uncharacterized protein n=1 Tax=Mycena rosella TaxID=1033263 RepID=A0AAD7GAR5_MYCRO|nr:hypothetical protein B0H17DRAFT_1137519 [Mycena rosella]